MRQTVADRVFDIQQLQHGVGSHRAPPDRHQRRSTRGRPRRDDLHEAPDQTESRSSTTRTPPAGAGSRCSSEPSGPHPPSPARPSAGTPPPPGVGSGYKTAWRSTFENTTISDNTATGTVGGGGILTDPSNGNPQGTATLTNVTVTDNNAPAGAGAGLASYGLINMRNTIVSDNNGANCSGDNLLAGLPGLQPRERQHLLPQPDGRPHGHRPAARAPRRQRRRAPRPTPSPRTALPPTPPGAVLRLTPISAASPGRTTPPVTSARTSSSRRRSSRRPPAASAPASAARGRGAGARQDRERRAGQGQGVRQAARAAPHARARRAGPSSR